MATIDRASTPQRPVICCVCEKAFQDKGKKSQDSVFCEGLCQSWMHRVCAGLSTPNFKLLCSSPKPYLCNYCHRDQYQQEVISLKEKILYLESLLPKSQSEQAVPESVSLPTLHKALQFC